MPAPYPESVVLARESGRSFLFADLLEVADMHNARLVVNAATKHSANPVLRPGVLGSWDSMQATPWQGTVIWDSDEHVFKCWYMGIDAEEAGIQQPRVGYAVSSDGIAWEKPSLGVCDYKGSRDNNMLVDNTPRRTNGACLKDPGDDDPARRYKLFLPDANWDKEIWNSPVSDPRVLQKEICAGFLIPRHGSTCTKSCMTRRIQIPSGATSATARCPARELRSGEAGQVAKAAWPTGQIPGPGPAPRLRVARVDGAQIQDRLHHLVDEPRQMLLWQPVRQRGRQQQQLVGRVGPEGLVPL